MLGAIVLGVRAVMAQHRVYTWLDQQRRLHPFKRLPALPRAEARESSIMAYWRNGVALNHPSDDPEFEPLRRQSTFRWNLVGAYFLVSGMVPIMFLVWMFLMLSVQGSPSR